MKYLGETSLKKLISLVKGDIAAKQNKITEVGILKGRGDGTVSATSPLILNSGTDYGATLPSSPATNQLFFQTIGSNFVLDNIYPVGSIYMNVNSTNPETLFGGTWEQIQGRFLLGMSSSYPAGSQGGEAEHTLTRNEIPNHDHYLGQQGYSYRMLLSNIAADDPNREAYTTLLTFSSEGYLKPTVTWGGYLTARDLVDTPHDQPHNNMPPYISVYICKRTA